MPEETKPFLTVAEALRSVERSAARSKRAPEKRMAEIAARVPGEGYEPSIVSFDVLGFRNVVETRHAHDIHNCESSPHRSRNSDPAATRMPGCSAAHLPTRCPTQSCVYDQGVALAAAFLVKYPEGPQLVTKEPIAANSTSAQNVPTMMKFPPILPLSS